MQIYHVEWAFLDDRFVPHSRGLSQIRIEGRQVFQEGVTILTHCEVPVARVTTLAVRWPKDTDCPALLLNHGSACGTLMAIEPRTLKWGDTAQPSWAHHMFVVYETATA